MYNVCMCVFVCMCMCVYVYEVQFVVRGLISFPYRLGHQQCKEGRWYWWIWGSGIIGALSSGSNYACRVAGSAVGLATAQIILDQKLPHMSMDGWIMPKNLPIILFAIAMIFAQILCQNMPTQIHN